MNFAITQCTTNKFFFLLFLDLGAHVTRKTVYVSTGMSAVLKCQINPNKVHVSSWEQFKDTYTLGFNVNPSLSNKVKIVGNITNGEYNLKIDNVSTTEEGKFKCFQNSYGYVTVVTLIIKGN